MDNDIKYGNYSFNSRVNNLVSGKFDRRMTYGAEPKIKAAWVNDTNVDKTTTI